MQQGVGRGGRGGHCGRGECGRGEHAPGTANAGARGGCNGCIGHGVADERGAWPRLCKVTAVRSLKGIGSMGSCPVYVWEFCGGGRGGGAGGLTAQLLKVAGPHTFWCGRLQRSAASEWPDVV